MRSLVFRARDKEIRLGSRVALMGVINVTPDSFYPGSRVPEPERAVERALGFVSAGADILDIGGESTRPGSLSISATEELARLVPVVRELRPLTDAILSVDTQKAEVAERCLDAGADVINDVSALTADPRMAEVVARAGAGLVVMHMRGTPETMQKEPRYADVVAEVRAHLERASRAAEAAGVAPESILVDPGIGFGKTVEHNLVLLNRLGALFDLGKPILVGTSRKNFLGKLLDRSAEERLMGTAASVACAVLRGADVVRVHDVSEMGDVVRVAEAVRNEQPRPPKDAAASGEVAGSTVGRAASAGSD